MQTTRCVLTLIGCTAATVSHLLEQVDWYEWGTEAFEKAKREDKPIFLSVGYSACHCMPNTSLENDLY